MAKKVKKKVLTKASASKPKSVFSVVEEGSRLKVSCPPCGIDVIEEGVVVWSSRCTGVELAVLSG